MEQVKWIGWMSLWSAIGSSEAFGFRLCLLLFSPNVGHLQCGVLFRSFLELETPSLPRFFHCVQGSEFAT